MSYVDMDVQDLRADTGPRYHLVGWIAGVLLFGVADLVTTFVGILHYGAVEGNPLPLLMIEAGGLWVLVVVKAVVFVAFWFVYHYSPPLYRTGVPLGLALLGAGVAGWNLGLLIVAGGL